MKRTPDLTRTARLLGGLAVIAALTGAASMAPTAQAIPGDGSGSDTPGSSASVSPSTLTAGSVISFRIGGFPAGEIVNVKVDDGTFCSSSGVHGACVVHQQRVSSAGSVSGSFALPADLAPGRHWLRFLASKDLGTDASGRPLGTKGYTLRGGANFTIVAGARAGSTPRGTSPGTATGPTATPEADGQAPSATASAGAAPGTTAAPPGAPAPSSVATPGHALVLEPSADQTSVATAPPAPTATASGATAPQGEPTATTEVAQAAATRDAQPIPWLGIGAGLALLVAAVTLQFVRRRG